MLTEYIALHCHPLSRAAIEDDLCSVPTYILLTQKTRSELILLTVLEHKQQHIRLQIRPYLVGL